MRRAQNSVDCAKVCLETLSLPVNVHLLIPLLCSRTACLLIMTLSMALPVPYTFNSPWAELSTSLLRSLRSSSSLLSVYPV